MNSQWFDDSGLSRPTLPPPAPEVGGAAPEWAVRDLGSALALVLLGFGGVVLLAGASVFLGDPRVDPVAAFAMAVLTLAFSLWLGVIVLLLARRRGVTLAGLGFGSPRGLHWFWPVGTWMAGLVIIAAYAVTVEVISNFTGSDLSRLVEGNPLQYTDAYATPTWIVLGLALIIGAPLGEELLFRGLVFRVVRARWGLIAGIVISGAAFALVHFEVSVVLPFWGIGMLFAWSYHRSGSLWTPVLAHAIFNGVSFAATIAGIA